MSVEMSETKVAGIIKRPSRRRQAVPVEGSDIERRWQLGEAPHALNPSRCHAQINLPPAR